MRASLYLLRALQTGMTLQPSRNNLAALSCKTCAFLQEKDFNFFLVFCRILQESCVHVPARFLQDPTKCKKKLRTFSCKIVQVLQDTLARLFLLGVAK